MVTGSVTTNNGGNLTVSLSGTAAFASAGYVCTATPQANGAGAAQITNQTNTSFVLRGSNNTAYGFICIGT
jgi:hypothetical protein